VIFNDDTHTSEIRVHDCKTNLELKNLIRISLILRISPEHEHAEVQLACFPRMVMINVIGNLI
jgi:hypothetical protein